MLDLEVFWTGIWSKFIWIYHLSLGAYFIVSCTFMACREAISRGTSVFLPTATYPMFPDKIAMGGMSLRQGEHCNAVTVSIVLHNDGRYILMLVESSCIIHHHIIYL